jgi:hypothetical protein
VDVESQEIVGFLVANFLSHVVLRAPHLTALLRIAELRAITAEELGGLEPPESPVPGPGTARESVQALATEFVLLIA